MLEILGVLALVFVLTAILGAVFWCAFLWIMDRRFQRAYRRWKIEQRAHARRVLV